MAGLQATLSHYTKGEAVEQVPVWQMISRPLAEIKRQAQRWARNCRAVDIPTEVIEGRSTVGGGSLPGGTLPTWLVALSPPSPDTLAERLRRGDPPVITRIEGDHLLLDPRTVLSGQERVLMGVIQDSVSR